jgi:hypothetical protein
LFVAGFAPCIGAEPLFANPSAEGIGHVKVLKSRYFEE